jgi:hypothetical protein
VAALWRRFAQHSNHFFVMRLVWVLFLAYVHSRFAQNRLDHKVIRIDFLVLGRLLLGLSLVLVSVGDEQLLEIGGVRSGVFVRRTNRFGRSNARSLVVLLLHMNSICRSFGLELAHKTGSDQVHPVFHLTNNFVRIHLLAAILARKSNGCIVVLLLLLRICLL